VLKQVAGLRRRDIEAKAIQYGLDMGKESDRLIAAEEVLSELAQTNSRSGLVQRAIAAIKKWIRDHVPGFENMMLSDSEIIERYLVPARDFVQRGLTGAPGAVAGAFSRKNLQSRLEVNQRLAALRDTLKPMPTRAAAIEAVEGNKSKNIKGFIRKELVNQETGIPGTVTGGSLDKMLHGSSWKKSDSILAHFLALGNLDTLFELATQPVSGRDGYKKDDALNLKAVHEFTTPMPYQGQVLNVVMTVKEFLRPGEYGNQIYTFEALKIVTPAQRGASTDLVSQSRPHPLTGVNKRLAQMQAIVKGELRPEDVNESPDIRFSPPSSTLTRRPASRCSPHSGSASTRSSTP
jgi:hypothetical protein